MDRYTKVVLTVIAIALCGILLRPFETAPIAHADGDSPHVSCTSVSDRNDHNETIRFMVIKGDTLHSYTIDSNGRFEHHDSKKVP